MDVVRFLRHALVPQWWAMRAFPPATLAALEAAIAASERQHTGELRFVVEAALPPQHLLAGRSARERAIELFAQLRVWDTEANSGVLIYVQLLDRKVEIVADRGIDARVGQAFWEAVCGRVQAAFHAGRFEAGALAAIGEITAALAAHFPPAAANPNELPDRPLLL
ncbi:TPM domain-containing protein [Azospira restricta]|uniref:TPM domain-containing protein n=1 Tax=Azospira restricta TaxID=404405 RepID=A0A974PWP2_9RHOO|nr:TPM domain-containing protein [Azospira restricta]QRJ62862.1 TPM domain-containing protein [Azospira restricta]